MITEIESASSGSDLNSSVSPSKEEQNTAVDTNNTLISDPSQNETSKDTSSSKKLKPKKTEKSQTKRNQKPNTKKEIHEKLDILILDQVCLENPHLNHRHLQEITGKNFKGKERGLKPEWGKSNCYSVTKEEASELLGYKSRSSGIYFHGANGQGQFKPDHPWASKTRPDKTAKYLTPMNPDGETYDVFLPNIPGKPNFWTSYKEISDRCKWIDNKPHIVLTEGAFKALTACQNNLLTISALGVEQGLTGKKNHPQNKRFLVPTLKALAEAGFGFIIAFDADIVEKKEVQLATMTLSLALQKLTSVYIVSAWDKKKGKGMDDFINNKGIETFIKHLEVCLMKSDKWIENAEIDTPTVIEMALEWVDRQEFRLNELTLEIEDKDQQEVDISFSRIDFLKEHKLSHKAIGIGDFETCCKMVAESYKYHPIKEWLEALPPAQQDLDVKNLASKYFGLNDELYNEMLYRQLIASVARVYEPGCKVHNALVLKGVQGSGKSSFIQNLYGEWYSNSVRGTNKDDLLVLHNYWGIELDEIDKITSKKEAANIKSFVTTSLDSFRPPYGRKTKKHPRMSVFWGSYNRDDFLKDSTGNRRFWVIPCDNNSIDYEQVEKDREKIWAAALAAYKKGEEWNLPGYLLRLVSEENQNYMKENPYLGAIEYFLKEGAGSFMERTCINQIWLDALEGDSIKDMKPGDQTLIKEGLAELGWVRKKKLKVTYNKQRHLAYFRPEQMKELNKESSSTVLKEVTHSNPVQEKVSDSRNLGNLEKENTFKNNQRTNNPDNNPSDSSENTSHAGENHPSKSFSSEINSSSSPPETLLNQDSLKTCIESDSEDYSQGNSNGNFKGNFKGKSEEISKSEQDGDEFFVSYPHLTSDDIRAKRNEAQKIKNQILQCNNKEKLCEIRSHWGERFEWVERMNETIASHIDKILNQLHLFESITINENYSVGDQVEYIGGNHNLCGKVCKVSRIEYIDEKDPTKGIEKIYGNFLGEACEYSLPIDKIRRMV